MPVHGLEFGIVEVMEFIWKSWLEILRDLYNLAFDWVDGSVEMNV